MRNPVLVDRYWQVPWLEHSSGQVLDRCTQVILIESQKLHASHSSAEQDARRRYVIPEELRGLSAEDTWDDPLVPDTDTAGMHRSFASPTWPLYPSTHGPQVFGVEIQGSLRESKKKVVEFDGLVYGG